MTSRVHTPEDFPDPIVTGSLYCSGCLDEVLLRVVVPFRQSLTAVAGIPSPYLWVVRYARNGEHLKVRVHGRLDQIPTIHDILCEIAEDFLRKIGPPQDGVERFARASAPPIDEEDNAPIPPPDRSFRFTGYRRSHVSLGGRPWLDNDRYCASMTTCLARATDLVLAKLEQQGSVLSHAQRQRLLLKALLTGVIALGFSREKAETYLAYHRDWLIRFPVQQRKGTEEEVAAALARIDQQIAKAGTTIETLRRAIESRWTSARSDPADGTDSAWGQALAALHDHLSELRREREWPADPFAADPAFPPFFKVFHGLANQLGLPRIDEAYAHHLLLEAVTQEPLRWRRVALNPAGQGR